MSELNNYEPLLDMFLFETIQLIDQLEQTVLSSEVENQNLTQDAINEIFRIMHTIKGSAAMMMYQNISTLAHKIEDIFYYLREEKPNNVDVSGLSELVLSGVDFIKNEVEKIKNNEEADGDCETLIQQMSIYLNHLMESNNQDIHTDKEEYKADVMEEGTERVQSIISEEQDINHTYTNAFKAVIFFEEGCEMENIRAFTVIRNLKSITDQIIYTPADIIDNDNTIETIRREGFHIFIKSDYSYEKMNEFLMQTVFLKDLELTRLENEEEIRSCFERTSDKHTEQTQVMSHVAEPGDSHKEVNTKEVNAKEVKSVSNTQSIISVSVAKLDKLMDLVGEMVISEAMVIQNPDLSGLELENFHKAARQLSKITTEMQDIVMSIRMVPLSATFNKMHRIVRDMCKKLDKDVKLELIGDDTEVDKNIIEHISDPLMHLVRNAIDHGIESTDVRLSKGKSQVGHVILQAENSGNDVLITVRDDGKGLDRASILRKAKENGLLTKSEEDMTDQEVFNLILLPGFSTNSNITEFSGRGVGMDVVAKNIEAVGGSLYIDSIPDKGTQITLKIPLTLAIIDGMNVRVGKSCYTIPLISIKQSFRPKESDIFIDTAGNELIMVRGECYPIIRLHKRFRIHTEITALTDGIIIMVEQGDHTICIFADELLGQQQVVVKTLPEYILNFKKIKGLSGCTLLGDGSISLIIDAAGLISM